MTSSIDVTKPVSGSPTTSSVRANFQAASDEITALQAIAPVAFGHIVSDGSGAQDVSNCVGVASCTISGSNFLVTLSNAVAGTDTMVITTGAGSGIGVRSDTVNQTSTTVFEYTMVLAGSAVTTSALEFHFVVMDAG